MNPDETITSAVTWLKAEAYAKGFREAHSRYCMLAAVVPESVSKAELIRLIKATVAESEQNLKRLEANLKEFDQ